MVSFEVKMSSRAGTMSLCIPYNVIEPVVDKLSNQTWAAYKRSTKDNQLRHRLESHLEGAKIEVTTLLADTTISVSDLMNLQVGDVILTEKPASSPLSLSVEGKRKYIGQLGQYRGNRAFKVTRAMSPKDRGLRTRHHAPGPIHLLVRLGESQPLVQTAGRVLRKNL